MKTKLFLLALVVLLVAGLAGGATMAVLTDEAVYEGNTFTAGTVEIAANRLDDPILGPMFYTTTDEGLMPGQDEQDIEHETGLWWPGRTVTRSLGVSNTGSLRVRLHQVSAKITSINGISASDENFPEDLAAAFAANMNVKIYRLLSPHLVLYDGPLQDLLGLPQDCSPHRPEIGPGVTRNLAFEVTMLSTAGNDLQGIVPVVSFYIHAEQTENNP